MSVSTLCNRLCVCWLALGLLATVPTLQQSVSAAEFHVIAGAMAESLFPNDFPGAVAVATAISGDGRTIGGQLHMTGVDFDCVRNDCGVAPFTWSLDDANLRRSILIPTPLNSRFGNAVPVSISALSYDGRTAFVNSEFRHYEAALYRDGQPQLLRPMAEQLESMTPGGMSSDSRVAVGNIGREPFVWTAESGVKSLEGVAANSSFRARAISGDGHVVVLNISADWYFPGWPDELKQGDGNAFQWTSDGGLAELLPLSGDEFSMATAATFDGHAIVGQSVEVPDAGTAIHTAVVWRDGGVFELQKVAGFAETWVSDVSADGSRIVGSTHRNGGFLHVPYTPLYPHVDNESRAAMWNKTGEVVDLYDLLRDRYGWNDRLAGWSLTSAECISDDGNVIAGQGIAPDGSQCIWIADLSAVPEPSAKFLVLACATVLAASRVRDKSYHRNERIARGLKK